MKKLYIISFLCFLVMLRVTAIAQPTIGTPNSEEKPLDYFLSNGEHHFNKNIPTPYQVLGYNVAEQMVDWNDILKYMQALDKTSDRVSIKSFGKTYENRRFIQVYITSEKNQEKLEEIRNEHLKITDISSSKGLDLENMPVVVDLMASIHGNEASGVNSTLVSAYYFAACTDKEVTELLDKTVVIITPGLNPDGINRFASWINTTRSENWVADLNSIEFTEAAPSSRSNHYWHDTNRDWLSTQHPEGQNGVKMYLDWMPNVVLDMHEMGGSAQGFYFSPGDARRTHSLIPQKNQDLLYQIATNTAAAFDEKGIFYFSKEGYDDYFIGKGAAYGDLLGSVAILHEQVSSRGMLRPTSWGDMSFASTVRNQSVASISVAFSAYKMRKDLLEYQRNFYIEQDKAVKKDVVKGYRFNTKGDRGRAFHFIQNLMNHGIDVYKENKSEDSYILPLNQDNYFTIKAMWDNITEFKDSTFYDMSTWTFPHAYNVDFTPLNSLAGVMGDKIEDNVFPKGSLEGGLTNVAYAFEQNEYYAPYMVSELLKRGLIVRVATQSFEYKYDGKSKVFAPGTIVVPVIYQPVKAEELNSIMADLAEQCAVDVISLKSGFMQNHDLGSRMFKHLAEPRIALVVGEGMATHGSGAAWYLLDKRFNLNHTLVEYTKLDKATDWSKYNVMIFIEGKPSKRLSETFYSRLNKWVNDGGTLIVAGEARIVANNAKLTNINIKHRNNVDGVIMQTSIRKSSPLSWGYTDKEVPMFTRKGTVYDKGDASSHANYTSKPYLSGCISKGGVEKMASSPAVLVKKAGNGHVVFFANDLNFRSFWYGTSKLFLNAIFYAPLI